MGDRSRGRFATPADFPLQDCSHYRGLHVRRESLGFVHRSRAIYCRPVPNLDLTIRTLFIAVRAFQCFVWMGAHAAASRRLLNPLFNTIIARPKGYAYTAEVWASSLVQGPFSVAQPHSPDSQQQTRHLNASLDARRYVCMMKSLMAGVKDSALWEAVRVWQLLLLQRVEGHWGVTAALADVLRAGEPLDDLAHSMPMYVTLRGEVYTLAGVPTRPAYSGCKSCES